MRKEHLKFPYSWMETVKSILMIHRLLSYLSREPEHKRSSTVMPKHPVKTWVPKKKKKRIYLFLLLILIVKRHLSNYHEEVKQNLTLRIFSFGNGESRGGLPLLYTFYVAMINIVLTEIVFNRYFNGEK